MSTKNSSENFFMATAPLTRFWIGAAAKLQRAGHFFGRLRKAGFTAVAVAPGKKARGYLIRNGSTRSVPSRFRVCDFQDILAVLPKPPLSLDKPKRLNLFIILGLILDPRVVAQDNFECSYNTPVAMACPPIIAMT